MFEFGVFHNRAPNSVTCVEEMAGSDRVPDPNDSKRAQVGNAQTNYESEMALFYECRQKSTQKTA